jgi:hypothetical protein
MPETSQNPEIYFIDDCSKDLTRAAAVVVESP